ncbi:hypothetical protein [Devosia rhizoryzae]|nr:hypothetical protein [Devosia rhizoryzae]
MTGDVATPFRKSIAETRIGNGRATAWCRRKLLGITAEFADDE